MEVIPSTDAGRWSAALLQPRNAEGCDEEEKGGGGAAGKRELTPLLCVL